MAGRGGVRYRCGGEWRCPLLALQDMASGRFASFRKGSDTPGPDSSEQPSGAEATFLAS